MKATLSRRAFLQQAGLMPLVARLALPSSLSLLWSSRAGAAGLNPESIMNLFGLVKTAFPHNALSDIQYQVVINALLDEAAENLETSQMMEDTLGALDQKAGGSWSAASPDAQLKAVDDLSGTPFFGKVKHAAVMKLYNDHSVWKTLGYEGESFSKGGYLQRGFNNLSWLPDPPETASPKPYGAQ